MLGVSVRVRVRVNSVLMLSSSYGRVRAIVRVNVRPK